MKINVLKIENHLEKLNQEIEKYEDYIFINLYNEFNNISYVWNDSHTKSFFDNVNVNKVKVAGFIEEIKSVRAVYRYLVNKYNDFGEKIYCILKNKDALLVKFDRYIDRLNNLIDYYDNLDLSFCYDERQILLGHKNKFIDMREDMYEIKKKTKNIFNDIEEIERVIKLKLSKIDIAIIKELKTSENNINRNVMDVDSVEKIIEKLRNYRNEESLVKEELNDRFIKLLNNYRTGNTDEFEKIVIEINNKFKKVINIHNGNIKELNQTCLAYRDAVSESTRVLRDII